MRPGATFSCLLALCCPSGHPARPPPVFLCPCPGLGPSPWPTGRAAAWGGGMRLGYPLSPLTAGVRKPQPADAPRQAADRVPDTRTAAGRRIGCLARRVDGMCPPRAWPPALRIDGTAHRAEGTEQGSPHPHSPVGGFPSRPSTTARSTHPPHGQRGVGGGMGVPQGQGCGTQSTAAWPQGAPWVMGGGVKGAGLRGTRGFVWVRGCEGWGQGTWGGVKGVVGGMLGSLRSTCLRLSTPKASGWGPPCPMPCALSRSEKTESSDPRPSLHLTLGSPCLST